MSKTRVTPITVTFDEDLSRQLGRSWFRLAEAVCFVDGFGNEYVIQTGFTTDLASVPKILWSIFPPFGFHLRASIVHDWLYENKQVSRAQADAIFLELMELYGVKTWKRWTMYLAVRAFGWKVWNGGKT